MSKAGRSVGAKQLALTITKCVLLVGGIAGLIAVNAWFALIIPALVLWMVIDVIIGATKKACIRRPADEVDWRGLPVNYAKVLWVLEHRTEKNPEIEFTFSELTEDLLYQAIKPDADWVNNRYDCTDFRALRLYLVAQAGDDVIDKISPGGKVRTLIDDTLLNMKLWITEKGRESVCYYSENHQLTFFVLAYLLGRRYEDKVFTNDNRTGKQKAAEARERILTWCELRSKYGFSEFYSHNYLPINFAQLSLLLMYGDRSDTVLMNSARAVLDLLCLDYAFGYSGGTVIGPQGRAYARNNINCAFKENNTDLVVDAIWNGSKRFGGDMYCKGEQGGLFAKLLRTTGEDGKPLYTVPEAIKNIGTWDKPTVIKTSSGVNLAYMQSEGLIGLSDRQIMLQLGMGALSNPEVINNTMDFVNQYGLLHNNFLTAFKFFNISLLRFLGIFPYVSKGLKLYPNGMALQKNNVYIYRCKDYKLSSLQKYDVGGYGAQQTTMAAVLPDGVTVYTHHPLKDNVFNTSPGFWGGYGVAPHCVQDKNVCMMVHRLPTKRGMLVPNKMPCYTHTFFAEELFDECKVAGHYAFCRKGNALLALIGTGDFVYMPHEAAKTEVMEGLLKNAKKRFELVQEGSRQATVYELSTVAEEGGFEAFIQRITGNELFFDGNLLTYKTAGRELSVTYGGDFTVNGEVQTAEYDRFESEFVNAPYLSEDFVINTGAAAWHINLPEEVRGEK